VSYVEVALTVRLDAVSFAPTVRTPSLVILVPKLALSTLQVTVWAGLPVPSTVAVKVWVSPRLTVVELGVTATFVIVGDDTVTVAVPDLLVSTVEVARIVRCPELSPAPTVRTPPLVILVPKLALSTLQVTVWAGLPVPSTVAVKVWVSPRLTVVELGVTATFVIVGALISIVAEA
jgi:hypothetical protein